MPELALPTIPLATSGRARPENGLADLARAARRLGANEDERALIAAMLSLASPATHAGLSRQPDQLGVGPAIGGPRITPIEPETPGEGPTGADLAARSDERSALVPSVLRRRPAPPSPPVEELVNGYDALPEPPAPDQVAEIPDQLFAARWARAIIAGAASVAEPFGETDVPEVVRRIALGRVVERLPRRSRPSLHRGAHVLVDAGEGMAPFRHDCQQLVPDVESVVGRERTIVRRFIGTPGRGAGTGFRSSWQPYEPQRGVPVLIVSDLGIAPVAGAASAAEWLELARGARAVGARLAAIVPYPAERVPRELRAVLHVVTWDRATTPSSVAREIGRRR